MLYLCRLFIFKKGSMQKNEIILYQSEDALVQLNVLVENETIWLSQAQIGILFGVQKAAISKHLKNIFASGELQPEAVVSILETTASDGKHYATKFYNLDAVLSIGYRVNSISATHFRIWANHVLKEYRPCLHNVFPWQGSHAFGTKKMNRDSNKNCCNEE